MWWLDNSGKTKPLIATPGFYLTPALFPRRPATGASCKFQATTGQSQSMTGNAIRCRASPSTPTQQTGYPTWSPDGKHIVFRFISANGYGLGWIRADGAGETQHLLDSKNIVTPYSFLPRRPTAGVLRA